MSSNASTSEGGTETLSYASEFGYDSIRMPVSVTKSTNTQVELKASRQRVWTVFMSAVIVSLPALLVGCTLSFSSGALLDLTDLEPRPDYKFDTTLSDVFGVCCFI